MNPLADMVELPIWQFLIVYSGLALAAGGFLLYVRWEARCVEDAPPAPIEPEDAAELARGRTAQRSPEVLERLRSRLLIVRPSSVTRVRAAVAALTAVFLGMSVVRLKLALDRDKPILGLALLVAATLAGGAALALTPLWLTTRGAAALDKSSAQS